MMSQFFRVVDDDASEKIFGTSRPIDMKRLPFFPANYLQIFTVFTDYLILKVVLEDRAFENENTP